jgi:hydroxymethylpyrimidine pyrophosphatase-like HAD family hydrolase
MANLYQILKDWKDDEKLKTLYMSGVICPKAMDYLVYYERYLEIKKQQKGISKILAIQWVADEYGIALRTMWRVLRFFEGDGKRS